VEGNQLTELEPRLRASLTAALRARDSVAVTAYRSALAAVDNAGAVEPPQGPVGAALGVGAREFRRRELSDEQVREIVQREISEREAAALEYETRGRADQAQRLREEASVMSTFLAS
jgi:uncharacterized protein YqeY